MSHFSENSWNIFQNLTRVIKTDRRCTEPTLLKAFASRERDEDQKQLARKKRRKCNLLIYNNWICKPVSVKALMKIRLIAKKFKARKIPS